MNIGITGFLICLKTAGGVYGWVPMDGACYCMMKKQITSGNIYLIIPQKKQQASLMEINLEVSLLMQPNRMYYGWQVQMACTNLTQKVKPFLPIKI